MPQPPSYTPTTDFSQQEAINASGRSTVNTAALDIELANIETTLDQTLANLTLIQRDDGKLKDLACELHTLSPEVLNLMGGFKLRGLWLSDTAYAVNDIASNAEYTYVCVTAHTSGGTFDEQYWIQFGFSGSADAAQAAAAAQVSANDANASADAAAASALSASGSATTATTQASNASTSAGTATTKAGEAAASATNAANSATTAQTAAANLPNAATAGADKFLQSNSTGTAWLYKTAAQVLSAIGAASSGNVPMDTHAATSKATPDDTDELPIVDSSASFVLKKLTWSNLKATLKTYFDTLYGAFPSQSGNAGKVLVTNGTTTAWGNSTGTTTAQSMVRVNTPNGYGSTNTRIARFTNVVTNQGSDITYADSATLGASFTINTSGVYGISFSASFVSGEFIGISLNTSAPSTSVNSLSASEITAISTSAGGNPANVAVGALYLAAGSVIRPHCGASAINSNALGQFVIGRVS